jgi:hypothetical protein
MFGFHPYFDIWHKCDGRVVGLHFTPKEIPWYLFLSEAECTQVLQEVDRLGHLKIIAVWYSILKDYQIARASLLLMWPVLSAIHTYICALPSTECLFDKTTALAILRLRYLGHHF